MASHWGQVDVQGLFRMWEVEVMRQKTKRTSAARAWGLSIQEVPN